MKKLVGCIMLLGMVVRADLLWSYTFDTDGAITNDSNWRSYSGADGSVSNFGGQFYSGAGAEDVGATNVYAAQSGQVYFGFTMNVVSSDAPSYITGFLTGSSTMSGRLYADDLSDTTFRLGLSGDSTTPVYATNVLTIGTTYRIVMGYDNSTDTHTLWINPGTGDVGTPNLSTTEAVANNPNGVFIRQGDSWDAGEAMWSGDNFAVGNTFSEVVPEPGTAALLLIGLGAVGAASRRRRT